MDVIIRKMNAYDENRVELYIDCDGVILDTNRYIRDELLKQYGIDKWTHKRSNIEDDKKVGQFFREFNWADHMEKIPEIKNSLKVIKALINCGMFYGPTIFTTCTSYEEAKVKKEYFNSKLPEISLDINMIPDQYKTRSFTMQYFFRGLNSYPLLIDDDPFNLNDWNGYAVPFNGGNPNYNFPAMESLEELFKMYARIDEFGKKFIPVYDNGAFQGYDIMQMFDMDPKTHYIVTDTMKKNLVLRKKQL